MINFKINGISVTAQKGETILNVARRNGIYIPTMCYLEKTSPSASCRLCVVEVEGVDGTVLSCQTKPVDGIEVITNSEALHKNRTDIMKMYDVNHPLECGVCDKSGACDLQNKTLEFGVSSQAFSAKEQSRKIEHWGMINYDPNLCIMCEKCTHVCNEVIGDDAIELKFGGYNSTIVPKGSDQLDCTNCGECIAVCPVGALVSSDFQYTANAWELNQIPATCSHCSAGCSLTYEVKHASALNPEPSIYRVTNNYEYSTLCGAGRFAYDFENKSVSKNKEAFEKALQIFKDAKEIRFDSIITNEEAYILQSLKEKLGIRLVNNDAYSYQRFLKSYQEVTNRLLYNANLDSIKNSDHVIVIGSRIATDNPAVRYHLTMASKQNKAHIVYMHPIEDALMQNSVTQFIKYEVGTEEGVIALLADTLIDSSVAPDNVEKFLKGLDEGYLSAESNVGEEEFELIAKKQKRAKKSTLVIGEDLIKHNRAENIAKIIGLIEEYSTFDVVIVPTQTNTLGVSLICDLEPSSSGLSVGYNVNADFVLSSLGDGDLDMPALNQQEGTFTSIDKRVVSTNVALPYGGYILNDIANCLGVNAKYTIDYTKDLGGIDGFRSVEFDSLKNFYEKDGSDDRGYILENIELNEVKFTLENIEELPSYDGIIIYKSQPVLEFSRFTHKTHQLASGSAKLVGSPQFAQVAKIADGDKVVIELGDYKYSRYFEVDKLLKGTIALHNTFDIDSIIDGYRFNKVKIMKDGK